MRVGSEAPFEASVYGLRFECDQHPHSGKIRYVGKSVNPVRRFQVHMNPKINRGAVHHAVVKYGAGAFSLEILATFSGDDRLAVDRLALDEEVRLIAELGTDSRPLGLNLTRGGEGSAVVGEALERKRRILEEVRATPQCIEANVRRIRQYNRDPGMRQKQSDGLRAYNTPDVRQAKSAAAARLHRDPSFEARYRAGLDARYSDPKLRAAHAEKTRERHRAHGLRHAVKMGIALHWAEKHTAAGKSAPAARQVNNLRALLAECGPDESRIKMLAEAFLEGAN